PHGPLAGPGDRQGACSQPTRPRLLEPPPESARHRGHRPTRVRAGSPTTVAPQRRQGSPPALPHQSGADDETQAGEARWNQVQEVVEPRGDLTEILERTQAISEHRVRGVDDAIDRRAREASREKEER